LSGTDLGSRMASIHQRAAEALADLVEQTRGIPTFAALVMVDGRIVLEHNAARPLCACSTFKVAAATAVMALVQEGTIDLDRPVLQYDSSLAFIDPVAAQEITLRQLLSHTSGLGDTDEPEPEPRECLGQLAFVARPGRAFHYSNVAFDVAVLTAAQRTGLSYEQFLQTRVLAPLAMNDTHWRSVSWRPSSRTGFTFNAPFTTARDLVHLAEEHLGGNRILRPHDLSEMHRIHADSFTAGPCRYYGLGIDVERWADRTLLSHGGGLDRYGTAFVIDRTERAAVALLFDHPAGYSVSAHALLDRVLDRQTTPPLPRPNTTEWAPYLGRYSNGAEVICRAGRLSVRWKDQEHLLEAVDERLFASKDEVSVGLLEGSPTMISVNDFILIGAQPGVLLEHL
jgi:CubicO group peptidase (beta-lactamase class C family)